MALMKPTTPKPNGPIQKYIGTAYDVVKEVYDNLDFLKVVNDDVDAALAETLGYRDEAFQFKEDALASSVASALSEINAASSESNSLAYMQSAAISEDNALASENSASSSEQNALTYSNNASTSEQNAAISESNASSSETNALASENKAYLWAEEDEDLEVETGEYSAHHHRNKAAVHDTNASNSATSASTSETNANNSAVAAATSETNAANSETSASNSASTATTKAAEALASANDAEDSEQNALTSAANALTNANNAELWAESPHGVEIEPGKYSSLHWATESELSAVGGLQYKGSWDASTGAYPTPAETGDYYKVSVSGTVNTIDYEANDAIIYNPSGDWDHINNTETVVSVAGKIGAVSLGILDISNLQASLDEKLDASSGVATDSSRLGNELPGYYLNWNNLTGTPTTLTGYGIDDSIYGRTDITDTFSSGLVLNHAADFQDYLPITGSPNTGRRLIDADQPESFFHFSTDSNYSGIAWGSDPSEFGQGVYLIGRPTFEEIAAYNQSGDQLFKANITGITANQFFGNGAAITSVNAYSLSGFSATQFVRSDNTDILEGNHYTFLSASSAPVELKDSLNVGTATGTKIIFRDSADTLVGSAGIDSGNAVLSSSLGRVHLEDVDGQKVNTVNSGVEITGTLETSGSITSNSFLNANTFYGDVQIGAVNSSYCHFVTDSPRYHMNKSLTVFGDIFATTSISAGNGASGSFTTSDGKTVTVTDGIITDIT